MKRKEIIVKTIFEQGKKKTNGEAMPRKDLRIRHVWPGVLQRMTEWSEEEKAEAAPALPALQCTLVSEATNAGVERSGGVKRMLQDVMGGHGSSDHLDRRMRVMSEGPSLPKISPNVKDQMAKLRDDGVLVDAAREFLMTERRIQSVKARKPRGTPTEEPKLKIKAGLKKVDAGSTVDKPADVTFAEGGDDFEVLEGEEVASMPNLFGI